MVWVALSLTRRYQLYIYASVKIYFTLHLMLIVLGNFFEAGARDSDFMWIVCGVVNTLDSDVLTVTYGGAASRGGRRGLLPASS